MGNYTPNLIKIQTTCIKEYNPKMERPFINFFNLPDEARVNMAKTLIKNPGIDLKTNTAIIINTPYLYEKPDKMDVTLEKIRNVNKILTGVKIEVDQVLNYFLNERFGLLETKLSTPEIIDIITKSNDSKMSLETLGSIDLVCHQITDRFLESKISPEDLVLTAANHIAICLAAQIYKKTENENNKSSAKSYLMYFVAIQSLLLGVNTNAHFFAHYPDQVDTQELKDIAVSLKYKSLEEVKFMSTQRIFDGDAVTPIKNLDDGASFFISGPKEDD